jgi:hypothetical protein
VGLINDRPNATKGEDRLPIDVDQNQDVAVRAVKFPLVLRRRPQLAQANPIEFHDPIEPISGEMLEGEVHGGVDTKGRHPV